MSATRSDVGLLAIQAKYWGILKIAKKPNGVNMYLHLYQQSCPKSEAKIICDKQAAADLIYALARALSTKQEEQVALRCKDGKFYYLKVKVEENITSNDSVQLPYLYDFEAVSITQDKANDTDVSNVSFELDSLGADCIVYEEKSDMSDESPF
ncbi:hypothetical protein [Microseira sp. BLCC-F43]|jgi:hypothetical protein|uniref:hypothetical protein n=1 Tax=Microseira sp. BLCC-F43 TaxID=3153602 RepID=UPI0035B79587